MSLRTLDEHLSYLADPIRHAKLRAAVQTVVRTGDRVVDLGCGSGVLGLLCLQHGAGFVEAIDESAMIETVRETYRRSGFPRQVRLHRENSFRVNLDEPADLVVCDHVGYFGFDYGLLELLADARRRFLKPGGRMLPRRLQLLLGAVSSDACRSMAEGWAAQEVTPEFHWLRGHGINSKHAVNLKPAELASGLEMIADIELGQEYPPLLNWQANIPVLCDAPIDGLVGTFRVELAENTWMSNSPLDPQAINRPQAFLPIDARVHAKAGDVLRATIRARPADHTISWEVVHLASGKRHAHSTFGSRLLSRAELQRALPSHRPQLNRKGLARRTVLGYVDGHRNTDDILEAILREHPNLFPNTAEIRRFVTATLMRDTE